MHSLLLIANSSMTLAMVHAVWQVPSLREWVCVLAKDRERGICHPFTEQMKNEVRS